MQDCFIKSIIQNGSPGAHVGNVDVLTVKREVKRVQKAVRRELLAAHGLVISGACSSSQLVPQSNVVGPAQGELPLAQPSPYLAPNRVLAIASDLATIKGLGTKPNARKPKRAGQGTLNTKRQNVVHVFGLIKVASENAALRETALRLLNAVDRDLPADENDIAHFLCFMERCISSNTPRYIRGLREALATLLQCGELPESGADAGLPSIPRTSFGKATSSGPLCPSIVKRLEELDTRGLDQRRFQLDVGSLTEEARSADAPSVTSLDSLAHCRNERIYGVLQNVAERILDPWIAGDEIIEWRYDSGDGAPIDHSLRIQDVALLQRPKGKDAVRHLSIHAVCSAALALMLYGYNFESLINGRFDLSNDVPIFRGRKPRAQDTPTPMRINDERLEQFARLAREVRSQSPGSSTIAGKRKLTGLVYQTREGWQLLTPDQFRDWFATVVVPALVTTTGVQGFTYTNIRPLVAQLLAHHHAGELEPVRRQLHHADLSETVCYVDSVEQRVRLDRVACDVAACGEALWVAALSIAQLKALGLDPIDVENRSEAFYDDFSRRYPGRRWSLAAAAEPPYLAFGYRRPSKSMPPPPAVHVVALLAAAAALLVEAEPLLHGAVTPGQRINVTVMPDGERPITLSCTPRQFIDLVDTAICIALSASCLEAEELDTVLATTPENRGGVWRASFKHDDRTHSRILTATAAQAVKIHKLIGRSSKGWLYQRTSRRSPFYRAPTEAALRSFCSRFGIAHQWAERPTSDARPLFSPARLRHALGTLALVQLGPERLPHTALSYICAAHAHHRAQSRTRALLEGYCADPVFAPLLHPGSTIFRHLERVWTESAIVPSTNLKAENDNIPLGQAGPPGWRRSDSHKLQLELRAEIIVAAHRHGLRPRCSFQAVREWENDALGLFKIGGNSLTPGNPYHGPQVRSVQKLLREKRTGIAVATLGELLEKLPANEVASLQTMGAAVLQRRKAKAAAKGNPPCIAAGNAAMLSYGAIALAEQGLGHTTVTNYKAGARSFLDFITGRGVALNAATLTISDVYTLVADWVEAAKADGLALSTINKNLKGLRLTALAAITKVPPLSALNEDVQQGVVHVETLPPLEIMEAVADASVRSRVFHNSGRRRHTPSDSDLTRVFIAASNTRSSARNRAMLMLSCALTVRVTEFVNLDFGNCQRSADGLTVFVSVVQKGGTVRMFAIPAHIFDLYINEAFLAERAAAIAAAERLGKVPDRDALFLTASGKRVDRRMAEWIFKSLAGAAGVAAVGPHALRRWGFKKIKEDLDTGVTGAEIMLATQAGHASSKTTTSNYVGRLENGVQQMPTTLRLASGHGLSAGARMAA